MQSLKYQIIHVSYVNVQTYIHIHSNCNICSKQALTCSFVLYSFLYQMFGRDACMSHLRHTTSY